MKAILEFDGPEDRADLRLALMAGDMHAALSEIHEIVRRHQKMYDTTDPVTQTLLGNIKRISDEFLIAGEF